MTEKTYQKLLEDHCAENNIALEDFLEDSVAWYRTLSSQRQDGEPFWHYKRRRKETDHAINQQRRGRIIHVSKLPFSKGNTYVKPKENEGKETQD